MNGLYKFTRLYNVSVVFDTSNKPFIKKCGLKTYKYKILIHTSGQWSIKAILGFLLSIS